ncbi:MAG: hypothetical protein BWK78_03535 [Thiotrichaceae bacterium IS1]|nr:MAG: hypothetical protein BWK78_03535 [Thiotrichaceae bacterium IS1]
MGATSIESFSSSGAELWEINSSTVIEQYQSDPRIEYIEPNYRVRTLGVPNDANFTKLWGMHNEGQTGGKVDADIDALEAWDISTGGEVVVAVIDTGVDYNHPDLTANMWVNTKEIASNGVDDDKNGYIDDVYGYDFANKDGDPMDDVDHGTHCSGTIAGVGNNGIGVTGVNWQAKIMALKFLGAGGGSTADAIKAVDYAVKIGAKISSNSWGCTNCYSQALYDTIKAADAQGHLFIAAAGNSGENNDGSRKGYPASYNLPNIIAVAATDHADNLASFSNYGKTAVDLGAPGVDIYSTIPGNSYASFNGTSMATPHVSGVAALLKAHKPAMTHSELKERILSTVDLIPSLDGKTVTGGRLNAHKAVNYGDQPPPPPPGTPAPKACFTAVAKGLCVLLDASCSSPLEQITGYGWTITKLVSESPIGGEQLFTCLNKTGTYTFSLTVKDVSGASNTVSANLRLKLPRLGRRAAGTDRDGNAVHTTSIFEGGVSVEDGEHQEQVTQSLREAVDVRGEVEVDSAHVGQFADIVVYAEFPTPTETLWFMLDDQGIPQLWDAKPETLLAFKHDVLLEPIQEIAMYKGYFLLPGYMRVYFGYRLQDGTLVRNGESINVTITE